MLQEGMWWWRWWCRGLKREEGMDPERKIDGNTLFCCSAFSLLLKRTRLWNFFKNRAHKARVMHLITCCSLRRLSGWNGFTMACKMSRNNSNYTIRMSEDNQTETMKAFRSLEKVWLCFFFLCRWWKPSRCMQTHWILISQSYKTNH